MLKSLAVLQHCVKEYNSDIQVPVKTLLFLFNYDYIPKAMLNMKIHE
jgi:hypothetical protein